MELTRTDAVFNRITMVLFMCRSKRSWNDLKLHGATFQKIRKIPAKDEGQGAHHLATRVGGAPAPLGRAPLPRGPPVASPTPTPPPYIEFRGEKNQREEFIAFYDMKPPPSPKPLGRADLESVQGSGEGNPTPSSSSTFLHHQFHDAHRRA